MQEADSLIARRLAGEGQGTGAAVFAGLCRSAGRPAPWLAASVGDYRLVAARYRHGHWVIDWSSTDQTYEASGQTPQPGVPADAPANMVGSGMVLPAQIHHSALHGRQRIVLASDGFFSVVPAEQLSALLDAEPTPLPADTAARWCALARERGSNDDVTVVLVEHVVTLAWLQPSSLLALLWLGAR